MIELWGTFLSLAGAFLTTGTQLFLFDSVFPRKEGKKNTLPQILFWAAASFVLTSFLLVRCGYLARIAAELMFLYLFCLNLHTSGWDRRLFVVITVYAVLYSYTYWFQNFSCWILGVTPRQLVENITLYSVLFLLSGVVSFVIAGGVRMYHKPLDLPHHPRAWVTPSLIFPLGTLLVLWQSYSAVQESRVWQICLLILNAVDLAALLLLDHLELSSINREKLVAANERMSIQEENIRALSQAYTGQRKMTHDFRAHLSTLSALLEEGKIQEAKGYLSELKAHQSERILLVNSRHAAIDAVLNQKGYAGQRQGIDMRFRVNDLSGLKPADVDITIVLSNLIDNAMEACVEFPPPERWVSVQLLLTQGGLSLSVVNPSRPVTIVNGKIPTSKPDPLLHGFGLGNVRSILDRYGAEYSFFYKEGRFIFSADWPNESKSE